MTLEDKTKEAGWLVTGAVYRPPGPLGEGALFTYITMSDRIDKNGKVTKEVKPNGYAYVPSGLLDKNRGGLYLVSKNGGYGNATGKLDLGDGTPISLDGRFDFLFGFREAKVLNLWLRKW